jgi:hypothetical protein
MNEDHESPSRVQHPLQVLQEIEQLAEIEMGSDRASSLDLPSPSARLLAEYVNAISELMAQGRDLDALSDVYTFDEGHAGGCG